MAVSREDVVRVAALARLSLGDAEADGLRRDLGEILGHVEALSDIEHRSSIIEHRSSNRSVAEVSEDPQDPQESIEHRAAAAGPLRDDEPGGDPVSGGPGAFAPAFRGGFFVVPRLTSHEDGGAGA